MNAITASWSGARCTGQIDVECSTDSPWCAFLGHDPHPARGSIDLIDEALPKEHVTQITLRSDPAACVLPILWFRTIWENTKDATITIDWQHDPSGSRSSPTSCMAARLSCLLADQVSIDERVLAEGEISFDPHDPGIPEDAFDLLSGIMDLWDPGLRSAILGDDWTSQMKEALNQCALDGHTRVGIYGAGTHTRAVGDAFMSPPVEVCCILDDDERREGERMWGYEIVSPKRALGMNLDAVVLSANSIEDLLWERSRPFREHGIDVYRLYS
jgi:hypothetical protein